MLPERPENRADSIGKENSRDTFTVFRGSSVSTTISCFDEPIVSQTITYRPLSSHLSTVKVGALRFAAVFSSSFDGEYADCGSSIIRPAGASRVISTYRKLACVGLNCIRRPALFGATDVDVTAVSYVRIVSIARCFGIRRI